VKTLTLYKAYKEVEQRKKIIIRSRGDFLFRPGHYGIAIDEDEDALRWQRRDRQAKKLDREITKRLNQD
jgi:ribosomal protein L20